MSLKHPLWLGSGYLCMSFAFCWLCFGGPDVSPFMLQIWWMYVVQYFTTRCSPSLAVLVTYQTTYILHTCSLGGCCGALLLPIHFA